MRYWNLHNALILDYNFFALATINYRTITKSWEGFFFRWILLLYYFFEMRRFEANECRFNTWIISSNQKTHTKKPVFSSQMNKEKPEKKKYKRQTWISIGVLPVTRFFFYIFFFCFCCVWILISFKKDERFSSRRNTWNE